jgi:hypothetical protein
MVKKILGMTDRIRIPPLGLIWIMVVMVIVDTSIMKIYHFSANIQLSGFALLMYILITTTLIVFGFLCVVTLDRMTRTIATARGFRILNRITKMIQFIISGALLYVIFQMLLYSSYSTILLIFITLLSYSYASITSGLLTYLLLSWFLKRRNIVVLLYGLAGSSLILNLIFSSTFVGFQLLTQPLDRPPHIGFFTPFYTSTTSMLNHWYNLSSVLSFILTWCATAVLLYFSSGIHKKTIYWIVIFIPLIYFLTQFQPIFYYIFTPIIEAEPLLVGTLLTLVFSWSKAIGGILFYLAFRSAAKSFDSTNVLHRYLITSGYGLLLIFATNQAIVLVSAAYPPFGLPTVSLVSISSYFLLVGIYSSAVSVAQNYELRKLVRKEAKSNARLLDSIGSAQLEDEIMRRVSRVTIQERESLENEAGVRSSATEQELRTYLQEVIQEIKEHKDKSQQ